MKPAGAHGTPAVALRERLGRLLTSRPFTPDERAILARHLTVTLWLAAATVAIAALITGLGGSGDASVVLAAGLPVALALRLARRRRIDLASLILVLSMLALATALLWRGDGLQDLGLLVYPVVVVIASLLFDRRLFVLVQLLAIGSLACVAWGQVHGHVRLLNEGLRAQVPRHFLVATLLLCVAAAMGHLLAEDLRGSLRAARRSEERYRLISEVTSDYTFSSVVEADGSVRQDWVAGAFETMTGYTFDEYVARGGWRAALHPDDAERDDQALEQLRRNQAVAVDLRTYTRSGQLRSVRVYARPVWDEARQRLAGIYGAVQDVTDRKRDEVEREALIRELEAKNAELERFTYTASHDLKSPLVTVRGFLGFVEKDALEGNHERLRADLRRIREATDRMSRLLDELLALSRVGRVVSAPELVPFGQLADEAMALVAGRISQRGVRVSVAPGLPVVWGDHARLLQVLQNLVENAVKFMGAQGQPQVEVGARSEGGQTVLFVRDNGVGLDPRHRERVFGLFDKLDPGSDGTGVGLALVRRIVELHGGRVWVESDGPGRGATFCFTLAPAPAAATGSLS